jgi:membrane protease YdiL (CAAX protease family)
VIAAIAAGVVGTAVAGMVLSWLRNRSGSLAAPAMVHIASNSIGFVLAWFVQR